MSNPSDGLRDRGASTRSTRGAPVRGGRGNGRLHTPSSGSRSRLSPPADPTGSVTERGGPSRKLPGTASQDFKSFNQTLTPSRLASIQAVKPLSVSSALSTITKIVPCSVSLDTREGAQPKQTASSWARVAEGSVDNPPGLPLVPHPKTGIPKASESAARVPPPTKLVFPPEQRKMKEERDALIKRQKEEDEQARKAKKREEESKKQQKLAKERERKKKWREKKRAEQKKKADALALLAAKNKLEEVLVSPLLAGKRTSGTQSLQPLLEEIHKYTENWPYLADERVDEPWRKYHMRIPFRGVFISLYAAPGTHYIVFMEEYRKRLAITETSWFVEKKQMRCIWASGSWDYLKPTYELAMKVLCDAKKMCDIATVFDDPKNPIKWSVRLGGKQIIFIISKTQAWTNISAEFEKEGSKYQKLLQRFWFNGSYSWWDVDKGHCGNNHFDMGPHIAEPIDSESDTKVAAVVRRQ